MSTPTHVVALVEALRRIGATTPTEWADGTTDAKCIACETRLGFCARDCLGRIARSALASWESRPRLDDDVDLVAHITVEVAPNVSLPDVRAVLAAVEVRLFGAPGKGTT